MHLADGVPLAFATNLPRDGIEQGLVAVVGAKQRPQIEMFNREETIVELAICC